MESYKQPYWGYILEKLPKDEQLLHCAAEYLYMRLEKNKQLSMSEWKDCIDELVGAYNIKPEQYTAKPKSRSRLIVKSVPEVSITDLRYLFIVATKRKWNHVYFTREQDIQYSNSTFYADARWHEMIKNPEIQKQLEERLSHGNWYKFE